MSISAGQGQHVSELMKRTRQFLDAVIAAEAEQERLEMLRKAAIGGSRQVRDGEGATSF